MKVLSFDTATKTGVCFGCAGETPRAWTVDLGKAEWPVRFSKTLIMTAHYIEKFRPDLVAVEQFVGGPKANSNLVGLVACVQGEATRLGVRVVSYYPASVRKHFLGGIKPPGNIKAAVYARCRMLGWKVEDTDAADAASLWAHTCSLDSRAHQITSVGGLFNGQ